MRLRPTSCKATRSDEPVPAQDGPCSRVTAHIARDSLRQAKQSREALQLTLLFAWTWEKTETRYKRNFILNLPFRTLFHVACDHLDRVGNEYATSARLREILAYRFFEQHSALPYPDSNGTLQQVAKTGERVLFCFEPFTSAEAVPRGAAWHKIAKEIKPVTDGDNVVGRPAPVPACLDRVQSIDQAKVWIAHRRNLVYFV